MPVRRVARVSRSPPMTRPKVARTASWRGGEVIALSSDDEVEGGGDGGAEGVEVGPEDEEIDVDEWRSAFPNDPNDGTGPDPARGTPYMTSLA